MAFTREGTGGVITRVSGKTIHTFLVGSTFDMTGCGAGDVDYLIVAGGGAGNADGGGGAGGMKSGTSLNFSNSSLITIGAGGVNSNGGDSTALSVTSTGGGRGGSGSNASNGGSGGGASEEGGSPGTGIVGQGKNGGTGFNSGGGGGGGAGAAGANSTGSGGGVGGVGLSSSISGVSAFYAGGGGGGSEVATPAIGGNGGGGNGTVSTSGGSGTSNTGGGGGGSGNGTPGVGGSGIVILSYTTPVAPTVTTTAVSLVDKTTAVSGGNVTSSGTATVTERGVVVGLTSNPTISDAKYISSGSTGPFVSQLTGLKQKTTYHLRAYATNIIGTSYGSDNSFTTTYSFVDFINQSTTATATDWIRPDEKRKKRRRG